MEVVCMLLNGHIWKNFYVITNWSLYYIWLRSQSGQNQFECQNMSLVLKVSCDETASTLRIRFGKHAEGTYLFIEFILKWWLIVNNKKFGLYQWLKDVCWGAIESKNDWQISFLEN